MRRPGAEWGESRRHPGRDYRDRKNQGRQSRSRSHALQPNRAACSEGIAGQGRGPAQTLEPSTSCPQTIRARVEGKFGTAGAPERPGNEGCCTGDTGREHWPARPDVKTLDDDDQPVGDGEGGCLGPGHQMPSDGETTVSLALRKRRTRAEGSGVASTKALAAPSAPSPPPHRCPHRPLECFAAPVSRPAASRPVVNASTPGPDGRSCSAGTRPSHRPPCGSSRPGPSRGPAPGRRRPKRPSRSRGAPARSRSTRA